MRSAACIALAAAALFAPAATAGSPKVTVSVEPAAVTTKLGHAFVLRTTIANHGSTSEAGLIAHLNVLSLGRGLYVDPEDWSSHRTRYLAPIPAGGSINLTWKLSAVNAGDLGVYIAVFPRRGAPVAPTPSRLVHVTIRDRQTLNAGGILPLALGVPALLAFALVFIRVTRRGLPGSRR